MAELMDTEFGVDLSEFAVADGDQTGDEQQTDQAEQEESQQAEHPEQEPEPETSGEQEPDGDETPEQPEQPEELFELKYNKDLYRVNREKMTELAQKGMNYDTIRQKYEEASGFRAKYDELQAQLSDAAKELGTDVPGLLDNLRLERYRKSGASESEARTMLENAKLKQQLGKKEQAEQTATDQRTAAREKAQRDLQQFMEIYGGRKDIDVQKLPKEVLEQAQQTSLAEAFSRYEAKQLAKENERLKQQLEASKKHRENKQKTPGSVASEAGDGGVDKFLAAFMADD